MAQIIRIHAVGGPTTLKGTIFPKNHQKGPAVVLQFQTISRKIKMESSKQTNVFE